MGAMGDPRFRPELHIGAAVLWKGPLPGEPGYAPDAEAERLCDLGWEIACEVTPDNAYATRVKLAQLRWMTAHMAPRRFGRFKAVEAEVTLEAAAEAAVNDKVTAFLVKHFKVEEREDGAQRMVCFVPDPRTNQLVRLTPQDAPWEPPPPGGFKPGRFAVPMDGGG